MAKCVCGAWEHGRDGDWIKSCRHGKRRFHAGVYPYTGGYWQLDCEGTDVPTFRREFYLAGLVMVNSIADLRKMGDKWLAARCSAAESGLGRIRRRRVMR